VVCLFDRIRVDRVNLRIFFAKHQMRPHNLCMIQSRDYDIDWAVDRAMCLGRFW
jgi:hypothetical protein